MFEYELNLKPSLTASRPSIDLLDKTHTTLSTLSKSLASSSSLALMFQGRYPPSLTFKTFKSSRQTRKILSSGNLLERSLLAQVQSRNFSQLPILFLIGPLLNSVDKNESNSNKKSVLFHYIR